ncbi:MAG TPA: hypothetical protein PLF84_09125, partial [Bryobacteraceae bacterium]|nr:hypothetical protein [Bryobacteraceae bacterium]
TPEHFAGSRRVVHGRRAKRSPARNDGWWNHQFQPEWWRLVHGLEPERSSSSVFRRLQLSLQQPHWRRLRRDDQRAVQRLLRWRQCPQCAVQRLFRRRQRPQCAVPERWLRWRRDEKRSVRRRLRWWRNAQRTFRRWRPEWWFGRWPGSRRPERITGSTDFPSGPRPY